MRPHTHAVTQSATALALKALADLGEVPKPGELWRPFKPLGTRLLSTEGRVLTLPHRQACSHRYGGASWRHFPAHLSAHGTDREPRFGRPGSKRYDLARAMLMTWDRPPNRPTEQARRRNGEAWDCRLSNLVWQDDADVVLMLNWLRKYIDGGDPVIIDIEVGVSRSHRCRLFADWRDLEVRVPVQTDVDGRQLVDARRAVGILVGLKFEADSRRRYKLVQAR